MNLDFALVESPSAGRRWVKARAELAESSLVVRDRRGVELFTVDAQREVVEGTRQRTWRYGDVTVQEMPGACSCSGGMRIEAMV